MNAGRWKSGVTTGCKVQMRAHVVQRECATCVIYAVQEFRVKDVRDVSECSAVHTTNAE